MLRPLYLTLLFVTAGATLAVQAQTNQTQTNKGLEAPAGAPEHKTTRLLNENYLTPTGETVPHPGESQGAPTSELDRLIEQKDNRVDQSICSNCK